MSGDPHHHHAHEHDHKGQEIFGQGFHTVCKSFVNPHRPSPTVSGPGQTNAAMVASLTKYKPRWSTS